MLWPLISRMSIVTKSLDTPTLGEIANDAQLEVIRRVEDNIRNHKPTRIIILKARQMGLSTIVEAITFALTMMVPRTKALIVSHERDSAEHILSMTQNYYDTFPFKDLFTQKNKAANHLSWDENKSAIRIATAKNVGAGRSQTLHILHGSEVAFWDNAEVLMKGLAQSIPHTPYSFVFLESTANGVGGYFHKAWIEAEAGENDYIPLFFPWWDFPDYKGSKMNLPKLVGELDEEERVVKKLLLQHMDEEEANDRLVWRRWAIPNLCHGDINTFHQEYPTTPEEAFISTGTNVFPLPKLNSVYDPMEGMTGRLVEEGSRVRFIEDDSGPLKIYVKPSADIEWGKYVVVGDPTRTTVGDYAAVQVLHRRTWEQVAVFRSKCDPVTFGDEIVRIGRYYNNALVNCEIEGPGYATISRVLSLNYPYVWENQLAYRYPVYTGSKYGWSSTWKTKQEAVGNLIKVVTDQDIVLHDRKTYEEMRNYVTDGKGFGNSDAEQHDDTVTSLAIAISTVLYEAPNLAAYVKGAPEREALAVLNTAVEEHRAPPWEGWDNHADL